MPCTAKKFEAQDLGDVDYVLTTRELASLWGRFGIDFSTFTDRAPLDPPFAEATGAARLFGGTGGVMEAAVRTAATLLGGAAPVGPLTEARGLDGFKCFNVDVNGITLNLGVINGLGRLRSTLPTALAGMHFVEVMSCPGGCSGGGGQPYDSDMTDVKKRMARIYDADQKAETKYSHDNKSVAELYEEYLGRPLGEVSHHLLHRTYVDKSASATPEAAETQAPEAAA